ncbi:MAG: signal peptide peptidase SppA [Caulobacteraceae bacterium]|nr:signal peptide peptidase SppA [Caulobacteraceae bacterium]
MKQFIVTVAGVFVGLLLFFVGVPLLIVALIASAARPSAPPAVSVLQLDLRGALPDQDPSNALAALRTHAPSVLSIEQTLRRAEADGRVKALFVRLPEGGIAPAAADELRLAFKHFRGAGKKVLVHSQGLYASGIVSSTYMLGASGDELWMQPGAPFQVTGLASEEMFFKRFFDKWDIKPEFEQRYQFKTAVNPYLYDDFTPAHRESDLSWMGSIYNTTLAAVAADRKMAPDALRAAVEAGPYSAEQAQAKGLVDKVGQVHDAQVTALAGAGPGAKLVDLDDYKASLRGQPDASSTDPVIAVVQAEGPIQTGTGGNDLFGSTANIYSDDVSDALYKAARDRSVKAIVLRVSSPGGGDTASEQILGAVRAAKAAGKPVVVSMGTYGASGGYWISSQASAIVAEPTTLTGSIGVYGGKFAIGEALSRFGVDVRQVGVGGDFASAYSVGKPFDAKQKAAFAKAIDDVYGGFIARVADGRHMSFDKVRDIAKGRVWTGAQAKQLGLVDEVGGFYEAVDKAKSLSGLTGRSVRLKRVTAGGSPLGAFGKALGISEDGVRALATLGAVMGDPKVQGLMAQVNTARLRQQGALVLAPTPVR